MIINTECNCGVKITVRTNEDAKTQGRKDGKQVVYTGKERKYKRSEYDIFRCDGCGEPINKSCSDAAYT